MMSKRHLVEFVELGVLLLIGYSIASHFVELEFSDTEHSEGFFLWSERVVAALFTIEFIIRWRTSRKLSYPIGFMPVIDLLAILPFYIGFLVDLRSLRLVRALRVLRLFKLYRYTNAMKSIRNAFHRVRYEFGIIGFALLTLIWVVSVAVFELERKPQPQVFGRFSDALWYTVTTVTTVGYGDKVPVTPGGRFVAVFLMISGLGLFGTFVSLIGSAFLEELGQTPVANDSVPSCLVGSDQRFDPERVLADIRRGAFANADGATNGRTVELLSLACESLMQAQSSQSAPSR